MNLIKKKNIEISGKVDLNAESKSDWLTTQLLL